jgi:hypothetical protein
MIKKFLTYGKLIGAAVAALLLAGSAAAQQYSADPFFADALELSHYYATEQLQVRFVALEAVMGEEGEYAEEYIEELEDGFEGDLQAFAGSLNDIDPELYLRLADTLDGLAEEVEAGEDITASLALARQLTAEAQDALLSAGFRAEPVNVAALMTRLLLSDGGVAEGFEEAVEGDLDEYPLGWAALQRVNELWPQLEQFADEDQTWEVEDLLAGLGELFPTFEPPADIEKRDPEQGEAAAHRIAGFLEDMMDASFYPNRDLALLSGFTSDLAAQGCSAFAEGNDAHGAELTTLAYFYYNEYLRRTLDLFAPDLQSETRAQLRSLRGAPADATEQCSSLLENLDEARGLFGG